VSKKSTTNSQAYEKHMQYMANERNLNTPSHTQYVLIMYFNTVPNFYEAFNVKSYTQILCNLMYAYMCYLSFRRSLHRNSLRLIL